ncbi:hypothetical protein [Ammoniphilus sp. CFH 90114]|uniref:hypothetical protein n=1 Tax=Ammoniphilus sp. CFH 90114 TaxID=2493665 RepID=UPI00100F3231|nr:hypothetical protein [Ammoniphilus sp. CFH 90114]RXT13579.1 hypothetical protein EIZ39_05350 [Ammoniphilus sp. CFH 90114]
MNSMLLLDRSPAEIWRLLLPKQNILFSRDHEYDDLIFRFRGHIYFVHEDGAVVRMKKPENLQILTPEDLWELLFHDKDTLDYDDCGLFSIGAILQHMGFLVPLKMGKSQRTYEVEVINRLDQHPQSYTYTLEDVTFRFALYHALLTCHDMNVQFEDTGEYEIESITPLELDSQKINPPSFG